MEWVQAVFLFALVLLLAWLTTRMVGYRAMGPGRGRMVRVLEHIPAGRDRSIMLLEVGGRIYLVGATAERIGLLDAIDDPGAIRQILANVPAPADTSLTGSLPVAFRDVFERIRGQAAGRSGGGSAAPFGAAPPDQSDDEIARLQAQIERLRSLQRK